MAPPDTPTPAGRSRALAEPPDRGIAADLTGPQDADTHPVAIGFMVQPPRTPKPTVGIRSRADAFTPTPYQQSKQMRVDGPAESRPGGEVPETLPPPERQEPSRPQRQAAVQAQARLTKEAQASALGLGSARSTPGSLGAFLGISGRKVTEDQQVTTPPSNADKEDSVMSETAATAVDPTASTATTSDSDLETIEAIQKRQRQRVADMTDLCRVIDKACISGVLAESGAELVRASLALAMRHGERGADAPPVASALVDLVRSYKVDKPHEFQKLEVRKDRGPAGNQSVGAAPPATQRTAGLPVQKPQQRRWENLAGMRMLGGVNGSAQALAEKGGLAARTVVVTLAADSPAHSMPAHKRMAVVNAALEAKGVPQNVRMLSSELNGMNLKIKPALNCSLEELFQQRDVIQSALGANEVHDSKQWVRYKVLFVPKQVEGLELSTTIIRDGIESSIGARLTREPHRLRHAESSAAPEWDHIQFAVLAEDKVRRPRVVGIAGVEYQVVEFVDKRRKAPCSHCLGFHKSFAAGCHSSARCEHCGSDAHATDQHRCKNCEGQAPRSCPPQCPNCSGPHRFDDPVCRMMPRMNKHTRCWLVPSTGQAKAVRNQGRIDYMRAAREATEKRKQTNAPSAAASGAAETATEGHSGAGALPGIHGVQTARKKRNRGGVKHRKRWSQGIVILQANVGKGERSTEAALVTAEKIGADVVLLQEPRMWWSDARREWVPRSWMNYEAFLPQGPKGATLPRVVTYVRNNHPQLRFTPMQHLLVEPSSDVLIVDITGAKGGTLRLVNVYSAPSGGNSVRQEEGVRVLNMAKLDAEGVPSMVAGDFNAFNKMWSTPTTCSKRSPAGIKLASWAKVGKWALALEEGTVTRRGAADEQDSALDLVFLSSAFSSSIWSATSKVRMDLATGSDHWPIVTELLPSQPLDPLNDTRPLNFKRTDWEQFARLVDERQQELERCMEALHQADTEEEAQLALDDAFGQLQNLLTSCLEATTPRCKGSDSGCRYWDAACDETLEAMRVAELDLSQARAEGWDERAVRTRRGKAVAAFERQLSRSKKEFFDERINQLCGNSIFAAMKWSSGGKRKGQSPPLVSEDGKVWVRGTDKMALLREVLLAPPAHTRRRLPDLHNPLSATLPDTPLRRDELRSAIFGQAQDKAAGPDGIPFRALRAAWSKLEEKLFVLFGRALAVGWHPKPFRQATLVALPKSGDRDPSLPRSYRLIALLPTLGKVLEKVVAGRLTGLGMEQGWIASEQFGSIPGRSTSDAALTLVHDIEAGWTHEQQLLTSALTFDVRGAYDAVHYVLLICHLHQQGVPLHLLRWILSFLSDRQASMRLDGEEGTMERVEVGIPQGSPVSPILYILFASSLHRLFGPGAVDPELRTVRLLSYVDDKLLYVASRCAEENARILAKAYDQAWRWAKKNGLRFDKEKKEFIEFAAARTSPQRTGSIELRDGEVKAVQLQSSFRWLGIELDPQLKFTRHVEEQTASAKRAAGGMAMLMNTQKGMRVADSRRLYIACIRSRLVYAAAVWWRGLTRVEPGRPHTRKKRGTNGVSRIPPDDPDTIKTNDHAARHAQMMNSAQHQALLRTLPAFKTTSKVALQVEAACPPMDLVLDNCLDRAALRLARMDHHHPLRARVEIMSAAPLVIVSQSTCSFATPPPISLDSTRAAVKRPYSTRLTALARKVPEYIEPAPSRLRQGALTLAQHPRVFIESAADWALPGGGGGKRFPQNAKSLEIFTDGSQLDNGRRVTGAGWVVCQDGMVLERHHQYTGEGREVFDAEAIALMRGTVRGLEVTCRLHASQLTIYADNQAVLHSLRSMTASSSTEAFAVISKSVQDILHLLPSLQVAFCWVRGHSNVPGNEAADTAAQEGAMRGEQAEPDSPATIISFATAARRSRERLQAAWQQRWEQERARAEEEGKVSDYMRSRLTPPTLRPSRLLALLPRREYALVLHLRTGHGDFSEYHHRFKHEDADTVCICGEIFTKLHPLRCSAYAYHAALLQDEHGIPLEVAELLGTDAGVQQLLQYARASQAFAANRTRATLAARAG
ncbi:hypothetical protein CF319_g8054 [Tilletia indica]|nr:hypothetical protein CF319_g8054 [Tilletia indica]